MWGLSKIFFSSSVSEAIATNSSNFCGFDCCRAVRALSISCMIFSLMNNLAANLPSLISVLSLFCFPEVFDSTSRKNRYLLMIKSKTTKTNTIGWGTLIIGCVVHARLAYSSITLIILIVFLMWYIVFIYYNGHLKIKMSDLFLN